MDRFVTRTKPAAQAATTSTSVDVVINPRDMNRNVLKPKKLASFYEAVAVYNISEVMGRFLTCSTPLADRPRAYHVAGANYDGMREYLKVVYDILQPKFRDIKRPETWLLWEKPDTNLNTQLQHAGRMAFVVIHDLKRVPILGNLDAFVADLDDGTSPFDHWVRSINERRASTPNDIREAQYYDMLRRTKTGRRNSMIHQNVTVNKNPLSPSSIFNMAKAALSMARANQHDVERQYQALQRLQEQHDLDAGPALTSDQLRNLRRLVTKRNRANRHTQHAMARVNTANSDRKRAQRAAASLASKTRANRVPEYKTVAARLRLDKEAIGTAATQTNALAASKWLLVASQLLMPPVSSRAKYVLHTLHLTLA